VVLVGHSDALPQALRTLDGAFVVAVTSPDQLSAYASLRTVRACHAEDVDGLVRAALDLAGIRQALPSPPHPDPFALLAESAAGHPDADSREGHALWRALGLLFAGAGTFPRRRPLLALGQAVLARKPLLAAVVSRKGGVGKTASAAAVAAIFGESLDGFGHSAALVDANIGNPDAWGRLDVQGHPTTVREIVAGLMNGREPPSPAWSKTPALAVYPESREAGDGYTPAQVQRLVGHLQARHAAIVVDLPNRLPSLGSGEAALAAAWIAEAAVVIIPTTADPTALTGVVEYLEVESVRAKPVVVPYIVPRLREIRNARVVHELVHRIRQRAAVVNIPDDDRATLSLIRKQAITEIGRELRHAYVELATRVVQAVTV